MNILAISGSARKLSSNSALLRKLSGVSPAHIDIKVYDSIDKLPIFSPDREGDHTPAEVNTFCQQIDLADALLIASPEYVRALPGGLKNAIDWLVSRSEIMHKPIALVHASHRGDDMLGSLRMVLATVSTRFDENSFLRIPLMAHEPGEIDELLSAECNFSAMHAFLLQFANFVNSPS